MSQNQACLSGNRSTSLNAPRNGDRVVPGFQALVLFPLNQVANKQPVLNLSAVLRPSLPRGSKLHLKGRILNISTFPALPRTVVGVKIPSQDKDGCFSLTVPSSDVTFNLPQSPACLLAGVPREPLCVSWTSSSPHLSVSISHRLSVRFLLAMSLALL